MKKLFPSLLLAAASVIFWSCSDNGDDGAVPPKGAPILQELIAYLNNGTDVGSRMFDLKYDNARRVVAYTIETSGMTLRHTIDYSADKVIDTWHDVGEIGIGEDMVVQIDCIRDTFFIENGCIVKHVSDDDFWYDEPDEGFAKWHYAYDGEKRLAKIVPNFPDYDFAERITFDYSQSSLVKSEVHEFTDSWYKYTYLFGHAAVSGFEWLPFVHSYYWPECHALLMAQGFYGKTLPAQLPSKITFDNSGGMTQTFLYDYVPDQDGRVSKIYQNGKLWAELKWKD